MKRMAECNQQYEAFLNTKEGMAKTYFCEKCDHRHRYTSKIGFIHLEYSSEEEDRKLAQEYWEKSPFCKELLEVMGTWGKETKPVSRFPTVYLGYAGELLAEEELNKRGYEVEPFSKCNSGLCFECGVAVDKEDFLAGRIPEDCPRGENWRTLIRYYKKLGGIPASRSHRGVALDYYARKDGEEYIVETKTNQGRLTKGQEKLIERAKSLGFRTVVIHTKVMVIGEIVGIERLDFDVGN